MKPRSAQTSPRLHFATSDTSLRAKIKILDDFQYVLTKGTSEESLVRFSEHRKNTGMHVAELWSRRQHKEFLRTLHAFTAQKTREKLERERALRSNKKLVTSRNLDVECNRLAYYDDPETAAKNYSMGRKGLMLQDMESTRKAASAAVTPKGHVRVSDVSTPKLRKALEYLISKCDQFEEMTDKKSPRAATSRREQSRREVMRQFHLRKFPGQSSYANSPR